MFDLYVQGDQGLDRSQGGLGIGLTLVRQLVNMHNGHVELHSQGHAKGSEFVIRLPSMPKPDQVNAAPMVAPISTESPAPCRVLLVDDNIDFAESMKLLLTHEGHSVEVCNDGKSAIELAKTMLTSVAERAVSRSCTLGQSATF